MPSKVKMALNHLNPAAFQAAFGEATVEEELSRLVVTRPSVEFDQMDRFLGYAAADKDFEDSFL